MLLAEICQSSVRPGAKVVRIAWNSGRTHPWGNEERPWSSQGVRSHIYTSVKREELRCDGSQADAFPDWCWPFGRGGNLHMPTNNSTVFGISVSSLSGRSKYPDGSAMSAVAVVAMVAALLAMISPSTELAVKSRCRPMLLEVSNAPGALTSHRRDPPAEEARGGSCMFRD